MIGTYKNYYQHVRTRKLINNSLLRVVKNYSNLGLWCVKDSQGRVTLNLWTLRVQF